MAALPSWGVQGEKDTGSVGADRSWTVGQTVVVRGSIFALAVTAVTEDMKREKILLHFSSLQNLSPCPGLADPRREPTDKGDIALADSSTSMTKQSEERCIWSLKTMA